MDEKCCKVICRWLGTSNAWKGKKQMTNLTPSTLVGILQVRAPSTVGGHLRALVKLQMDVVRVIQRLHASPDNHHSSVDRWFPWRVRELHLFTVDDVVSPKECFYTCEIPFDVELTNKPEMVICNWYFFVFIKSSSGNLVWIGLDWIDLRVLVDHELGDMVHCNFNPALDPRRC